MKLSHFVVAGTAVLSLGAIATGAQARGDQAQGGQAAHAQVHAGLSADAIRQAQEKLRAAGHDVGRADGIMGPRTKQGLKAFQQSKGIEATGQLNQQTLAALGVESAATGATSGAMPQRSVKTPASAPESGPATAGSGQESPQQPKY